MDELAKEEGKMRFENCYFSCETPLKTPEESYENTACRFPEKFYESTSEQSSD
jgi:hypothetical protein